MRLVIETANNVSVTMTAYGFGERYRRTHNIESKLVGVDIYDDRRFIILHYEREAHRLDMGQIAMELKARVAVFGQGLDGNWKNWLICGIR